MKYTKEERLEIGRRIYSGELSRYEAGEQYGICPNTARAGNPARAVRYVYVGIQLVRTLFSSARMPLRKVSRLISTGW